MTPREVLTDWDPIAPGEVVAYALEWSADLQTGELISTSDWTLPTGVAHASGHPPSIAGTQTVFWPDIDGAADGSEFIVEGSIVTSNGQTIKKRSKLVVMTDRDVGR